MSEADHDHHPAADEPVRGSATPLERELAALEPAPPAPGLRERIAAELAAAPVGPQAGWLVRGVIERLAWAVGGALAATVVIGLPAGDAARPAAPGRIVEADPAVGLAADGPTQPSPVAGRPLVSEEAGGWADEGIRFLDDTTPARVLRRMVVERHRIPDGQAEVRVPRADVILLPVAFH